MTAVIPAITTPHSLQMSDISSTIVSGFRTNLKEIETIYLLSGGIIPAAVPMKPVAERSHV
jgi:hypothetical protein